METNSGSRPEFYFSAAGFRHIMESGNIMTNIIKLGPRLQKVASFVPPEAILADIGTDHAFLPVYLIQKKIIKKAIGVDIHPGPYESARKTVEMCGLQGRIDIRFGNGLGPLAKGEVDTLVVAGMGGTTILEILQGNSSVTEGITTLVLQPQGAEAQVRVGLLSLGWKLKEECLVEEDGRIYTVICFSQLEGYQKKDIEIRIGHLQADINSVINNGDSKQEGNLEFIPERSKIIHKYLWQCGPLILLKKDKLLRNIIKNIIAGRKKIIREMNNTDRDEVKHESKRLQQEVICLEGILTWLFP